MKAVIKSRKMVNFLKVAIFLVIIVVLLAPGATSCGKKDGVSKEVEKIFEKGIIEPFDLSQSPLDELALPTAELEIPAIELPNLDMDISLDISSLLPK